MNRHIQKIISIIFFISVLITLAWTQDAQEIREAYQAAKMKGVDQKWTEAIAMFDEFLEKYPESKYEDDVLFWTGYSQQQIVGHEQESFNTYSKLVNKFPNSTWADDAQRHQITLAEKFILKEGKVVYKDFLYEQLRKEDKDIQYRSAIVLGNMGDNKALPVLEKMKNDEDYGDVALKLIIALSTDRIPIDDETRKIEDKKKLDLMYDKDQFKSEEEEDDVPTFDTERYGQYRSMLRKDDDWSEEELTDFAFWHILETDEFKEYKALASKDDKEEWRRKFWKRRDPTPTTRENEFEEEFQRRIKHSRMYFAEFWNYKSFKYLPDQHLRFGWPHAPWDSRGELYIKYGEPDFRSPIGFHQEVWTYQRYSVDFMVKQYMTNIYGNAIAAGELSYKIYGNTGGGFNTFDHLNPLSSAGRLSDFLWNNVNAYVQANFIFNQEIRYAYDYKAKPIEDLRLLFDEELSEEKKRIIFRYQLPVEEFKLVSQPGGLEVRYKEAYCVLDEDLREVAKQEIIRKIGNIPNEDYKFEESIMLNLPKGKYTLHLRIEDQNADNLGIFSHKFEVMDL